MKVIDQGHQYELENLDGGTQEIQFIKKQTTTPDSKELETVINGTTNEEVLAVLINRLGYLYEKLPDANTQEAKKNLESALHLLETRTQDRKARGVEGTNQE